MENRLEELTQKLRREGLERGQKEASEVLNEAKAQANEIVENAKAEAAKIVQEAETKAAELAKNTASEVKMASQQTLSALKTQIQEMVTAKVVEPQVSAIWKSGEAVKELILAAIKSWNPSDENGVQVIVPEALVAELKKAVAAEFKAGVELSSNGKVKVPFRIAPKEGGYYVDFSDEAFNELLSGAMRAKVAEFLFTK